MGDSTHCIPVLRKAIKDLHKDGNSYRKISRLLEISKTMIENAFKWIPVRETLGSKPKITPAVKQGIVRCVKRIHLFHRNRQKKTRFKH